MFNLKAKHIEVGKTKFSQFPHNLTGAEK